MKTRERGVSYIEATREDIATADRLMKELMRRSLDELPPQTRRLLELIDQMDGECQRLNERRFSVLAAATCARTPAGAHTQVRCISTV